MPGNEGRVREHVWVSGRVQGVFYRETTRREAERLGVHGWIRNLADGRVEAVLEGPPHAVRALLDWCRHGPPGARVSELQTTPETPHGEQTFRVVR